MKKIVTILLTAFLFATASKAQYVTIPDANFRSFLQGKYAAAFNGSGQMDTTNSLIVGETNINCSNKNITSLLGIEYFKKLRILNCDSNLITQLNRLTDSISSLSCSHNLIDSFTSFPQKLIRFDCSYNNISKLPYAPNGGMRFFCSHNLLTNLGFLWSFTDTLIASYNQFTNHIDVPSGIVDVSHNNTTSITTPLFSGVKSLDCSFSPNLDYIRSTIGAISVVANHCPLLVNGSLDIFSQPFYNLKNLDINNTNISCLGVLPSTLETFYCGNTGMTCLSNKPVNLKVYDTSITLITLPICNATNNANQCKAYTVVYGKVFTDNNSNGVKETNEYYRPFVKVSLTNGQTAYTNLNGAFTISTDSIGSYTLKTTAPQYYQAVPDSNNFSFTQYNTTLTLADIALQPLVAKDSFAIAATAFTNRPRPGFNYTYSIGYGNVGTISSATNNIVHFHFDSSRLIFDSANVLVQSIVNGNEILVNAGALVAGQTGSFNLYFIVKQSAVIGDSVKALATIDYSGVNTFSYYTAAIVGSYDPNDKQATPALSPTQVANGEYIDYTIRFQNVGNATATNIVIADTLSSLLQPLNFKLIAMSHNPNITIANGIIYLEFLNINLPDSHTNNLMSNGFVKFQLKPLATVALGAIIDNKASIYFDYNKAVVTNIASTIIKTPTVPVVVKSYKASPTPPREGLKNWSVLNEWSVGVEINVSHYVVQRSINGKDFTTVGKVAANSSSHYSFTDKLTTSNLPLTIYYRLQIIGRDGSYTYSEVRSIDLNEKQETRNLVLYPNPARDIVNIETAGGKELLIIDYLGRTILSKQKINNQQSIINIQQFKKGLYLVKLLMNNGAIRTGKLIVE